MHDTTEPLNTGGRRTPMRHAHKGRVEPAGRSDSPAGSPSPVMTMTEAIEDVLRETAREMADESLTDSMRKRISRVRRVA